MQCNAMQALCLINDVFSGHCTEVHFEHTVEGTMKLTFFVAENGGRREIIQINNVLNFAQFFTAIYRTCWLSTNPCGKVYTIMHQAMSDPEILNTLLTDGVNGLTNVASLCNVNLGDYERLQFSIYIDNHKDVFRKLAALRHEMMRMQMAI
jgi:hypothetical protein